MLRTYFETNDDKFLYISNYIYNNFDKFISNKDIKIYIDNSTDIINKYKKIWFYLDDNRIISNIIALNIAILLNFM